MHGYLIESFQDFLIEFDMKPRMHLVKISIFSLIMNNLLEHLKILIFKVIFQCGQLIESFQFFFLLRIRLGDQLLLKNVLENFDF
jgi:hypothetical protein